MKKTEKISNTTNMSGESPKKRGRPVVNDIMHLQGSIPATPEELVLRMPLEILNSES